MFWKDAFAIPIICKFIVLKITILLTVFVYSTRVVLRNISHVGGADLEKDLDPFLKYIDSYLASKHNVSRPIMA